MVAHLYYRAKAHGGAPRLPGSYVVCSNCHKKCVDALELTAHWRKEHAGESMTSPPHRPVVKAPRASRDATVGDVLATAKRLIASKKDGSSSEKRPMLYAIVGIESADRMKKFVDLTENNSFDNVMFFDASLVNKMCCDNDSDIKQEETSAMDSSSQMEVSGSGVFETVKKEKLESTDSMDDDQGICILNILPSRDDLPTTSEGPGGQTTPVRTFLNRAIGHRVWCAAYTELLRRRVFHHLNDRKI
ncbi:unnamed protein product [Nippostrongylus brasiliensis]|uniref:C2H2-type domain-containing protein n=1 Tax=Nippostrongylus brasiliensis TaxID=27835 RepID=A0A0N4YUT8_NIPBR|nr:unnamed protein product [Nippostrongylus brasiliensis]